MTNKELQQIIAPHKKQMLHAVGIAFLHPKTEELITLKAAYRQEFSELVQRLTLAN